MLSFGDAVGSVKEFVHAEDEFKLSLRKDGIGRLWGFRDRSIVHPGTESRGKTVTQTVFGDDVQRVSAGGGIGKSWAGGQSGFPADRNVAYGESDCRCRVGCFREASSFQGGEVFADGIDLVDSRAASDERAVELLNVKEGKRGE